jgi:hypothetical protein
MKLITTVVIYLLFISVWWSHKEEQTETRSGNPDKVLGMAGDPRGHGKNRQAKTQDSLEWMSEWMKESLSPINCCLVLCRKGALLFNNIFSIVPAILMGCSKVAKSFELIIISRLLVGICAGKPHCHLAMLI